MIDLGSFLAMGGYAAYVWPAYGAGVVILAAVWFDGLRRRRAVERALQAVAQSRENDA
ncbi:heme exporter protein CcmD [Dongia mobilis]|jgi:heme exporter protein D|uniref:heme exporter protein CcmD n=1 Tax=Dongia sp. TaxID=1977262 RepID=UPI0026F017B6